MKTPDVDVLLHAVNRDSPQHQPALRWLEAAFVAPAGIGFAWAALLGFLRIATRVGIFAKPLPLSTALGVVDGWLQHPAARVLLPGEGHAALLGRLLVGAGGAGNLVSDAHLAAIAMEHGTTLGTFDRDFARFAGLRCDFLE